MTAAENQPPPMTSKTAMQTLIDRLTEFNVLRLGEGCPTDVYFSHNVSGSFCQTAVMCWAVYQH